MPYIRNSISTIPVVEDVIDYLNRADHSAPVDMEAYYTYLTQSIQNIKIKNRHDRVKLRHMQFGLQVLKENTRFDSVYQRLSDDESRKIFKWFIQFRIAASLLTEDEAVTLFPGWISPDEYKDITIKAWKRINTKDLPFIRGTITPHMAALLVADNWLLEQYRLPGICEVSEKDTVLDVGAYLGDTALYFSEKAGKKGHVYAIEGDSENYGWLLKNISQSRHKNIIPVKYAVWDKKEKLSFSGNSSASRISDTASGNESEALPLDEIVEKHKIKKVSFIKMDIEGAEQKALLGAEKTIRTYGPKLAIAIYHEADDLYQIPAIIENYNSNYKFYIRNFTPFSRETILFAVCS